MSFGEAVPAEPAAPRAVTPEMVERILTDPRTPEPLRQWTQEHLAVRGEDGSFTPRTAEEIVATLDRLQQDAMQAVREPDQLDQPASDPGQVEPVSRDRANPDELWSDPPWQQEQRRPSLDELIPNTDAEVARWEGAVREEFARQLDSREFAGMRLRLDLTDEHSVTVYRNSVTVRLDIVDPEQGLVGRTVRSFTRDYDGSLFVEHNSLKLSDGVQGRGFASEWNRFLEDWYRYSGVDRIEIHASSSVGGFAWARAGYDWAPNTEHRAEAVMGRLRTEMHGLREDIAQVERWLAGDDTVDLGPLRQRLGVADPDALVAELGRQHEDGRQILDQAARHPFGSPGYPTPAEVSYAGWNGQHGRDATWPGKQAMLGADWKGVKLISDGGPQFPRQITASEVPRSQFHPFGRETPAPELVAQVGREALNQAVGRTPAEAPVRQVPIELRTVDADQLVTLVDGEPTGAVARSIPVDSQGRDLPPGTVPTDGGGYRVELSDRAADLAAQRAMVHEVAELSAVLERAASGLDPWAPDTLRPGEFAAGSRLSPHDLGRLAEIEKLAEWLHDPAHAGYARAELAAAREHLGLRPDEPGATTRQHLIDQHLSAEASQAIRASAEVVPWEGMTAPSTHFDGQAREGTAPAIDIPARRLHILAFDGGPGAGHSGALERLSIALGDLGDRVVLRVPDVPARELAPGVEVRGAAPLPGVTGKLSPLLRTDGLPADVDVVVGYRETAGVADVRRDAYPNAKIVQILDSVPESADHLAVLARADLVVAVGPEVAREVRAMLDELGLDHPPSVHEVPVGPEVSPGQVARELHDAARELGPEVSRVDDATWNRELSARDVVLRRAGGEETAAAGTLKVMTTFPAWSSEGGGGATANRELAASFALAGTEVYARVPTVGAGAPGQVFTDPATGVHVVGANPVWGVVDAKGLPDLRALMMVLDNLPPHIDVMVGHSRFSGGAAAWLAEHVYPDAQYVHMLHSLPEQLDALRGTPQEGVQHAQTERRLMGDAELVVGVGPLLAQEAARLSGPPPPPVHTMISDMPAAPGDPPARPPDRSGFNILIQGRVTDPLKGVEFAARIVAALQSEGIEVRLTARGAPATAVEAQARQLSEVAGTEVTVRPRTTDARELRQDLYDADLVLMPSVHEGFGLVASEAARAGVPVLVGEGTGAGMFFGDPGYVPANLGEPATVRDGVTVQAVWDALGRSADPPEAVAELDRRRLPIWVEQVRRAVMQLDTERVRALDLRGFIDSRYSPGSAARTILEVLHGGQPGGPVATPPQPGGGGVPGAVVAADRVAPVLRGEESSARPGRTEPIGDVPEPQ